MITVLGSINVDLIAKTSRLPRPGETVSGKTAETAPGGKGANQALAVRRAGQEVRLVGAIGTDSFAGLSLSILRDAGVQLEDIRSVDGTTGAAFILIGDDGENMITVVSGANSAVTDGDVDTCLSRMRAGDILMLQLEIPCRLVERALVAAREQGIRSILNIAPAMEDAKRLMKIADIIVANETEFEFMAGEKLDSPEVQLAALQRIHAEYHQTIVVTLGSAGVVAVSNGKVTRAAGLNITPVDTVGAGDTFCGYLAAGLAQGDDLSVALRDAAIAGSLACLRDGAQTAIPMRSELLAHLG
jgi:ribokinase